MPPSVAPKSTTWSSRQVNGLSVPVFSTIAMPALSRAEPGVSTLSPHPLIRHSGSSPCNKNGKSPRGDVSSNWSKRLDDRTRVSKGPSMAPRSYDWAGLRRSRGLAPPREPELPEPPATMSVVLLKIVRAPPLICHGGSSTLSGNARPDISLWKYLLMPEKPLAWVGASLDDLRAFPDEARREVGYQLGRVQAGLDPTRLAAHVNGWPRGCRARWRMVQEHRRRR